LPNFSPAHFLPCSTIYSNVASTPPRTLQFALQCLKPSHDDRLQSQI
jgi:hypothetical protein